MALWSVIPTLARTHPGKSSNGNQKQQSRRLPRFPTLQVIGKLTEWGVLDQSDNKTVDFSWLLGYDLSASDVLLDDGLGNYPLHILCFHFLKCSWEQAHLLIWVFEKMQGARSTFLAVWVNVPNVFASKKPANKCAALSQVSFFTCPISASAQAVKRVWTAASAWGR